MWIGADPGGEDAFGLAILNDDGQFSTHCFSFADEAIKHVRFFADCAAKKWPLRGSRS